MLVFIDMIAKVIFEKVCARLQVELNWMHI